MFKAVTVAGLTSAQRLVQDTQKDVNKEGEKPSGQSLGLIMMSH
jgi:hypothetical protein